MKKIMMSTTVATIILLLGVTALADELVVVSQPGSEIQVYGPIYAYQGPEGVWGESVDAVGAWPHGAWVDRKPVDAAWISNTYETNGTLTVHQWRKFVMEFDIPGVPTATGGSITINSDNAEEVYVNGTPVHSYGILQGSVPTPDDGEHQIQNTKPIVPTLLLSGTNMLEVIVRNYASTSSSSYDNPTALAYRLVVDYTANQPPVALCQNVEVEAGSGCEAYASVDGGSTDPDGDPITMSQVPAGPYGLGETPVILTVTDDSGASDTCTATVTVLDTTPPVILAATVAPQLVEVLGTVNYDGVVGDECDPTVVWDFGDGESSGDITTTHDYAAAGIYTVTLTVTDSSGNESTEEFIVVVYDLSGGFVTGGGWIYSDPGAYVPDPTLEGKANFGFVSKYKKGTTTPTGQTEFVFKTADLNFHSSSYQWLVVTGSNYARFKGTGTINGSGDYKFHIWAGDDNPDTFRIRIWTEDQVGVETDVYDNGFDQAIGGGSIVIHTK